jgi:hypothetical protein
VFLFWGTCFGPKINLPEMKDQLSRPGNGKMAGQRVVAGVLNRDVKLKLQGRNCPGDWSIWWRKQDFQPRFSDMPGKR